MDEAVQSNIENLFICTSCGYLGESRTITKGNFLIEVILWLFLVVPGLIYTIWRLTSKHSACPKCGNPSMIPVDTPKGQELLKSYHKEDKALKQIIEERQEEKKKSGFKKAFIVFILIPIIFMLLVVLSNK